MLLNEGSDQKTRHMMEGNLMNLRKKTGRRCAVLGLIGFIFLCYSQVSGQPLSEDFLKFFRYREIGPTRQGGRVVAFAVTKQDPHIFFVGAGPGGVWKTVNNGHSFSPVFDHENISSIGDIAVAPSDPNIVWIGTGEANLRNSTYFGNGMYKSVDGGKTWNHMGLEESHHIGRVLIHPENPDILYVAAQGHLYSENPERGIYQTTDGGKTWVKSLEVIVDGRYIGATDLVMDPTDPEILYAASYDRRRWAWSFRTAGPGSGIHKTIDGGKTWDKLVQGLPGGMLGKIGLAIYPENPKILYATVDNANIPGMSYDKRYKELFEGKPPSQPTIGHGIYRSDDGGASWRLVSPEGKSIGNRSNYYGQIIVDPNDAGHVFVLSSRVDESTDGGRTWKRAFRYGGDNHVLWIDPDDSRHMLMGYDYGMAITYDSGKNWYHPDELPMAQLYAIGVDMDFPYNVYGGMQDFGSWKGPSTKKGRFPIRFEDWEHVQGGDGFYNQVDPTNSRWLYSESQFGGLGRIDQKTGERKYIQFEEESGIRFNWNAPFLLSPHNPEVIYHGANVVLRSSNKGESWEKISPDLTTNDPQKIEGVGAVQYCTITTLAESPVERGVIWAGTDDGNVHITRDGGKTWVNLNDRIPGNPRYWVSRIIASHFDAGTAYLTYTGFHADDFRPFVYRTTDFGDTWASLAGDLPDESVNVIREDHKNPDLLFIGTDMAVYVSIDGGEHWNRMKNNMPTIPVHDLVIHPRENDLVVGTHGRGFFITDISPLQELVPEVISQDVHLFSIEPKVQWIMPSQKATSAQNFAGENESHAVVINYYLKQPVKGDVKVAVYDKMRVINEFAGENRQGLNRVEWGMTWRRKRSKEEIERWERWQRFMEEDEEFFDYYDTVEWFGDPDEEVDKWGRSLQTRVHQPPGMTDRKYAHYRVKPGEYTIKLMADGKVLKSRVVILPDYWCEE
jgi:photosystem II stability/assembly factor-like uncharacterized protein